MRNFPWSAKGTFCFQTTGLLPDTGWGSLGLGGANVSIQFICYKTNKQTNNEVTISDTEASSPALMQSEKCVFCGGGCFLVAYSRRRDDLMTWPTLCERIGGVLCHDSACAQAHWPRGRLCVGNSSTPLTSAAYTSGARRIHIHTAAEESDGVRRPAKYTPLSFCERLACWRNPIPYFYYRYGCFSFQYQPKLLSLRYK